MLACFGKGIGEHWSIRKISQKKKYFLSHIGQHLSVIILVYPLYSLLPIIIIYYLYSHKITFTTEGFYKYSYVIIYEGTKTRREWESNILICIICSTYVIFLETP